MQWIEQHDTEGTFKINTFPDKISDELTKVICEQRQNFEAKENSFNLFSALSQEISQS